MTYKKLRAFASIATLAVTLSLAGCAKRVAKVTPPPPPAATPVAPSAELAANPSAVSPGQASVLSWHTNNADDITIQGIGSVPPSGSRSVQPSSSTTYTLVAKGAGGKSETSARVTVNPATADATPSPTDEELFARSVKDVFFDYDKYVIRPDEGSTVQNNEAFLSQHPTVKVVVEGHCDDRGSEEYNIALGASRAENVKKMLIQEGIPADRIRTVSYGKEKPFCTEDNEQCWQQNRVDHFAFER